MSLFRKASEPEPIAWPPSGSDSIPSREFDSELGDAARRARPRRPSASRAGFIAIGGGRLLFLFLARRTTACCPAGLELEDTHDAAELAALLRRNLDPRLALDLARRRRRRAVARRCASRSRSTASTATPCCSRSSRGLLGDDTLAEPRPRAARRPPRGEQEEQAADARTRPRRVAARSRPPASAPATSAGTWSVERRARAAVRRRSCATPARASCFMHAARVRRRRRQRRGRCAGCCWRATGRQRPPRARRRCPAAPALFAACAIPAHAIAAPGARLGPRARSCGSPTTTTSRRRRAEWSLVDRASSRCSCSATSTPSSRSGAGRASSTATTRRPSGRSASSCGAAPAARCRCSASAR